MEYRIPIGLAEDIRNDTAATSIDVLLWTARFGISARTALQSGSCRPILGFQLLLTRE
jgi:hypothetical protein